MLGDQVLTQLPFLNYACKQPWRFEYLQPTPVLHILLNACVSNLRGNICFYGEGVGVGSLC